ncbi:MAG TPA: Holliday junction branch migration protein RuvA [Candidatus Eisenbergiella merdipullorum]|uniref:Holliday junction branch migration complex subunit RuvA n=1 Tax=Candidatus Eisenbergiella merdipullorum TaxID=2838553 RepID=A0A9D2IAA4_9FIRM|nr:Holliday junction branch migration protein RuvA [Candidatus Eisenbergiella merdipullorum]
MFAYLIGRVAGVTEDNLVLEVGQIGFNVKIPASLPALLPPPGEEVKIYTYTCVREDAFLLYGFLSQDELDMFRLLITVSGIGPKGGLAILSVMSADDVRLAVLTQDAKAIARAPGVGPKTAQRVILDLKDKVSMEETFVSKESEAYAAGTGLSDAKREAAEALTALGYSSSEAARAVRKVENADEMDVEELLKAALKHLF